jgi:hypothetical protein
MKAQITPTLILALIPSLASATLINLTIDPRDGQIKQFNNGDEWEYTASIDPLTLTQGDSLSIQIQFFDGYRVQMSDLGGLDKPDNTGFEQIQVRFYGSGGSTWSTNTSYSFIADNGALIPSEPILGGSTGSGNLFSPLLDYRTDLTDSSLFFKGIRLDTTLDFYSSPDGIWDQLNLSLFAEDVRVIHRATAVSAPPPFVLMLTGVLILWMQRYMRFLHVGLNE